MQNQIPLLQIRNLAFRYAQSDCDVINDLNLDVYPNECLVLLGPSGSGKTTLLKLICGLLTDYRGTISFEGTTMKGPCDRIQMIFQNYGLFPWKNVENNILLPCRISGKKKAPAEIDHLLEYLGVKEEAKKLPDQLSGGQKQRAALGRALVSDAELLLMDEPFSALDVANREKLREFTKKFLNDTSMSAVMVTHSVEEALYMGDRIAVFDECSGQIREIMDNRIKADASTEEMFRAVTELRARLAYVGEGAR